MLLLSMILVLVSACGSGSDYKSSDETSLETSGAAMNNDESAPSEIYYEAEESIKEDGDDENATQTLSAANAGRNLSYGYISPGAKTQPMVSERLFSSAAVAFNVNDSLRPFIISADLRFRVANVEKSTYAIEDVVIANKGYVESTFLRSTVQSSRTIPISRDSTLEQVDYVLENRMTLRVPSKHLDRVLRKIGAESEFFDHRNLTAENITFDLVDKELERKRLAKYHSRLSKAIDDKGRKLESIESAEEALLRADERNDRNTVEKLRMLDKVEYSTLEVFIYQNESVFTKVAANRKNIAQYEPSFWSKLGDSFIEGWEIVQDFILVLARAWFLLLIAGFALWFLLKKYRTSK